MTTTLKERQARRDALRPLFEYMRDHGVKKTWLAERLDLAYSTLLSYETGIAPAPGWLIEQACRALEIMPARLGMTAAPPRARRRAS